MIAIIDYDMGNVRSLVNAFNLLGEENIVTSDSNLIRRADAIVLPGVGSFSQGMKNLIKKDLVYV